MQTTCFGPLLCLIKQGEKYKKALCIPQRKRFIGIIEKLKDSVGLKKRLKEMKYQTVEETLHLPLSQKSL